MTERSIQAESMRKLTAICLPVATIALALLASSCAVGPNYKTPKTTVSSAFGNANQPHLETNDVAVVWWQEFHDRTLDQLVDRALAHNHDLRIAAATLREARALRRTSQFDLLPTVNGDAGWSRTVLSKAALPGVPRSGRETELYDLGFDATWELDIFGRLRRSLEANSAEVQLAVANQRDVQVSLISEVARNYLELRGSQNELAVARRNATNQTSTVNITRARLEGGRGTELDVARAQAQLSSTLAIIPPLESQVAHAMHRLSVLLGEQPTVLVPELIQPEPLPPLPALVSIGKPEALLRRRSDIKVAERRLAAATARIGVATADLFPRVTFNGSLALEARTLSGLSSGGTDAYSFGPRITWAALDLGHVRARIQAAGARAEGALAFYERAVLIALEETENALVDFGRQQSRRDYLQQSVEASQTAAKLARERFENGATDFLTVLDAERVMLEAQDQLAQSQTQAATALVAVYKALGGGWEKPPASAAAN
jgi:multidrug efflux system outer membrane protein